MPSSLVKQVKDTHAARTRRFLFFFPSAVLEITVHNPPLDVPAQEAESGRVAGRGLFSLGQCADAAGDRGRTLSLRSPCSVTAQPDSSPARLGFSTGTARRAPGGRSQFTPPCPWHRGSGSTLAASKLCLSPSVPPASLMLHLRDLVV